MYIGEKLDQDAKISQFLQKNLKMVYFLQY